MDSGHSIRYQNKYYRTILESGNPIYLKKGSTALVIEAFDGHLYANVLDQLHILEETPEHRDYSRNFEVVKKEVKVKKQYIPPMSRPWKHATYINCLMKMKHRNSGVNV